MLFASFLRHSEISVTRSLYAWCGKPLSNGDFLGRRATATLICLTFTSNSMHSLRAGDNENTVCLITLLRECLCAMKTGHRFWLVVGRSFCDRDKGPSPRLSEWSKLIYERKTRQMDWKGVRDCYPSARRVFRKQLDRRSIIPLTAPERDDASLDSREIQPTTLGS